MGGGDVSRKFFWDPSLIAVGHAKRRLAYSKRPRGCPMHKWDCPLDKAGDEGLNPKNYLFVQPIHARHGLPFLSLTWYLWGGTWKIIFLLQGPSVSCHVSGREGIYLFLEKAPSRPLQIEPSLPKTSWELPHPQHALLGWQLEVARGWFRVFGHLTSGWWT